MVRYVFPIPLSQSLFFCIRKTEALSLERTGKCSGGLGFSRSEEISRSWKRISKSRPSDAPNLSHSITPLSPDSLIPAVKDLLLIPPPPSLSHLGLGLHDNLSPSTLRIWNKSFRKGYVEALEKSMIRIQESLDRWELWDRQGKLKDGTRRLCTFSDVLETRQYKSFRKGWEGEEQRGSNDQEEELDPLFNKFLESRQLTIVTPSIALDLLQLHEEKLKEENFRVCFEPDCSDLPGVPRLSLSGNGKDSREDREEREKAIEREEREDEERRKGRKHEVGCAHERGREAWKV